MTSTTVISLVALLLSVLTFVATQFNARRSSSAGYIRRLEEQVKDLTVRVEDLERVNRDLRAENVDLLRQLVAARRP